jgi:3-deoxy-manno-octulosonate cytidylyltransferase (CMP-KDO synthetase)
MQFTVIIPARMHSTRLPEKPLADIAGRPMIVRVAQRALQSQATQVVVATDDERIEHVCKEHGIKALMTSAAHPCGSDRLAQAAGLLGLADDDIVVNVQGDEPLVSAQLIDAMAALLRQHPQAAMGTAAHPVKSWQDFVNPNVVKVVCNAQGLAQYFSRAPIPHARTRADTQWWESGRKIGAAAGSNPSFAPLRHVGIYGYRVAFLRLFPHLTPAPTEQVEALEQLRVLWHGHQIVVHLCEHAPGPGVDTPEDLERVRKLWRE